MDFKRDSPQPNNCVFALRMIREKHLENRQDLDMVIVDLETPRTEWKETLRDRRR